MRGLVPASSNCFTWAFTLPVLMSPLGFSAVFCRAREEQYHTEGQCHMKEQYHITAVNLRDPGSKRALHGARPAVRGVLLWSACARNLTGPRPCWAPLPPLGGLSAQLGGDVGWGRGRRSCCLGRAPGDAGHLSTLPHDS